MKWVTREHVKVDRVACPWLIKRFIDAEAELLFAPAKDVLAVAEREEAVSYDARGQGRYDHREGKCTFEVLVEEYDLAGTTRRSGCWPTSSTGPTPPTGITRPSRRGYAP